MTAFDDNNRNIAWMNSTADLGQLPAITSALGGSFTDVLLPRTASAADVNRVRSFRRHLDALPFGCGIYEIAFTSATVDHPHVQASMKAHAEHADGKEAALHVVQHVEKQEHEGSRRFARDTHFLREHELREFALSAAQGFANQVIADIHRLRDAGGSPGYVDLDNEVSDALLGQFNRDVVAIVRKEFPTILLRINVDPNKTWSVPVDLMQSDPYLYCAVQTYYGDMSMVAPWALKDALYAAGVPKQKVHLCIGWATQARSASEPWHRVSAVPSVFYQGNAIKRLPGPTTVFSTDLGAEAGEL